MLVTTENVSSMGAEPTPSVSLRRSRLRAVLTTALVAFVLLVGFGAFLLINVISGSDRSTPEVAIRQFLQAAIVDHNISRAQSYTCDGHQAAAIAAKFHNIDDPLVHVTWGVSSVNTNGDSAEAIVEVDFEFEQHIDPQQWRFELLQQGGWRVCDANEDKSLEPK
jgi:hypothetical protein